MIGFLDENQGRSYPFKPDIPAWLKPVVVDLQAFYGPDRVFNVATSELVLYEVSAVGSDWLFDFRIRGGTPFPLVVTVPSSAPVFSTYHVATAGNRSYIYLTVGDMQTVQPWQAANIDEGLAVEDRCVIAPDFRAVETVTVKNGQANRSLLDFFDYVSPTNPALNYAAAAAQWDYDPDVLDDGTTWQLFNTIELKAGANARIAVEDDRIVIRLREEDGTGRDCCFVLPDAQTTRRTFRTFMGCAVGQQGDLSLTVGSGISWESVPTENTLRLLVGSPVNTSRCPPAEQPNPQTIPEPPA